MNIFDIENTFRGTIIMLGIWVFGKFFWMIYYEVKFGREIENAGEKYLKFGKEIFKGDKNE